MVGGRRPELTRLALVAAVRLFWLRNFLQPKMQCRFRDLKCVQFLHGAGVDDEGIGCRFLSSIWTRVRVRMESGLMELFWSVASLISLDVIVVEDWGRLSISREGVREAWEEMESSSYGMMWGYWGVGSGVIVNGRPEGVAIAVELLDLGSI